MYVLGIFCSAVDRDVIVEYQVTWGYEETRLDPPAAPEVEVLGARWADDPAIMVDEASYLSVVEWATTYAEDDFLEHASVVEEDRENG
jgi:hypothetical protein